MAADQALRLSPGQALRALDGIDLPRLVAERLRAGDHQQAAVRLWPAPASAACPADADADAETEAETAVEDPETGAVALLPTRTLQMIWTAGLTVLACRLLVAPGVLTAAVFGSGTGLDLQVSLLARSLPALGHVTLPRAPGPDDCGARAELDQAGIGSAAVPDPRQAALGANLLVLTPSAGPVPGLGPPVPGTLLVDAAGHDLPGPVTDRADRIYVDEPRLLARREQEFGWARQAAPRDGTAPLLGEREGWYRRPAAGSRTPRVAGGLAGVLDGSVPGRGSDEEVLLAELLGTAVLDAALAGRIWQSAAARGLGQPVTGRSRTETAE